MNSGMRLLMLVWPYMIYNSTYMSVAPTIILLKERPKYIPKNTFKKVEDYKKKVICHNVRSRLRGK